MRIIYIDLDSMLYSNWMFSNISYFDGIKLILLFTGWNKF